LVLESVGWCCVGNETGLNEELFDLVGRCLDAFEGTVMDETCLRVVFCSLIAFFGCFVAQFGKDVQESDVIAARSWRKESPGIRIFTV
jgi:hypothetical protein